MLNNASNKKVPFKVPENYFQDFNTKIMEQLPIEGKTKKVIPLWKKVLPVAVAVAACVTIIFNVVSITDVTQDSSTQPYATISEDEIFDIMEDQLIVSRYQDVLFEEIIYTE